MIFQGICWISVILPARNIGYRNIEDLFIFYQNGNKRLKTCVIIRKKEGGGRIGRKRALHHPSGHHVVKACFLGIQWAARWHLRDFGSIDDCRAQHECRERELPLLWIKSCRKTGGNESGYRLYAADPCGHLTGLGFIPVSNRLTGKYHLRLD